VKVGNAVAEESFFFTAADSWSLFVPDFPSKVYKPLFLKKEDTEF